MRSVFHNIHYATIGLIYFAGFAGFLASPTLAQNRAQPIRALIAEVDTAEEKGWVLVKRLRELAAGNEAKKRSYEQIDAELKAIQPRVDSYSARLDKYNAQRTDHAKRVDAYNAKCGETRLPEDKYRECLAEEGELAALKIELERINGELAREYQQIVGDRRSATARLDAVAKDMAATFAAWEAAQKEYVALLASIEERGKRLTSLCVAADAADDPFARKECARKRWNKEKKQFTPLTALPPAK
jgi:chromosome segregation ATPase